MTSPSTAAAGRTPPAPLPEPPPAAAFEADVERMNRQLRDLGAVVEAEDGTAWVDPGKAPPGLIDAYRGLTRFGYATGLL